MQYKYLELSRVSHTFPGFAAKQFLRLVLVSVLLVSVFVGTSWSQGSNEGALLFLTIEPGGRPTGMGSAFIAEANDVSASYWNPAGLAFLDTAKTDIMFSYSNWIPLLNDIYHAFFAYQKYIEGWGHYGLNLSFMNYGLQEQRTPDGAELPSFNSSEYAFTPLSFATKIINDISVGINFKIIFSNLFPGRPGLQAARGNSYAVDFGLLHKNFIYKDLALALGIYNIGPNISYSAPDKSDPLPQHIKLGFAYRIKSDEYNELLFLVDVRKTLISVNGDPFITALITSWTDEKVSQEWIKLEQNVGVEYWYASWIGLRTGVKLNLAKNVPSTPTFGASINYDTDQVLYRIDLSYLTAARNIIDNTYRFSLSALF